MKKEMTRRTYFLVFVVAFLLVAFFLAWRDERHQVSEARQNLSDVKNNLAVVKQDLLTVKQDLLVEKKKNGPDLQGQFLRVSRGPAPGNKTAAMITLWLTFTNKGADSIADSWLLKIAIPNRAEIEVAPVYFPKPIVLSGNSPSPYVLRPSDTCFEKFKEKPLANGGRISCHLEFLLKGLTSDQMTPDTKLDLSYSDVTGLKQMITRDNSQDIAVGPQYIPGLDLPISPRSKKRKRVR